MEAPPGEGQVPAEEAPPPSEQGQQQEQTEEEKPKGDAPAAAEEPAAEEPAAEEAVEDVKMAEDEDEDEDEEDEPPTGGLLAKIKVEVKQEKMLKSGMKRAREDDELVKAEVKREKKSVSFGGIPDLPSESVAVKLEREAVLSMGGQISQEEDRMGDDEAQILWGEGRGEGLFEKSPAVKQAIDMIAGNEWNTDAWGVVLQECQSHPLSDTEDVYTRFLYLYPSAAGVIQDLIQAIEKDERMDPEDRKQRVDQVFMGRLAMANQHLNVWRQYLDYVDRKGDFQQTQKAFKFAVDRVGTDFESARLWKEYIAFYSRRGSEFAIQNEIRKTFHRMLRTPLEGLELHWKDYQQWEKGSGNYRIPDTLISDHEKAKYHYKEIRTWTARIDTNGLPKPMGLDQPGAPALPSLYLGDKVSRDFEQAALWMKLIDFELTNPMVLDDALFVARIQVICKKALVGLSRCPMFWYVLAKFLFEHEKYSDANVIFCEGIAANPDCLVLRFAYAHMLSHLQPTRALKTPIKRDGDAGQLPQPPPKGLSEDETFIQTVWQGIGQGMTVKTSEVAMKGRYEKFGPFVLGCAVFEDALARLGTAETNERLRALTWIQFAKFMKTVARQEAEQERYRNHYVPRACQEAATCTGEFYSALARLEQPPPAADQSGAFDPRAIMEAGFARQRELGKYDATFILRYVDFLWRMGDEKSLRFLFTQLFDARGSAAPEGDWQAQCDKNALLEVYNRYVEFEVWKGELKQVHTAEARREAKFGRMRVGSCMRQLVGRYSYQGLVPATLEELKVIEQLDFAYFRLCQISQSGQDAQEIHSKNLELAGTADPQEEILPGHKCPLRTSRLQYPETRTKWRPFIVPMNRNKWQPNDDQNTDAPKQRVDAQYMTAWNPKKAPKADTGGPNLASGATRLDDEDEFSEMPSYVAHLARILPAKHTWQGTRPKSSVVLKYFKQHSIPSLVNGRVAPEKLQEAKKTLETIGIDTTRILERRQEAMRAISGRRAMAEQSGISAEKKLVDKAQLALSIILTHARQNPRQQEERDRERENEQ